LAHTALKAGDRVGLMVYDHRVVRWVPPRGGMDTAHRLIRATYDVFPSEGETDHALAFRQLAGRVRNRSLVVLLTHVADRVGAEGVESLVRAVSGRHLPVAVWLRDPALDALADDPQAEAHAAGAAAHLLE